MDRDRREFAAAKRQLKNRYPTRAWRIVSHYGNPSPTMRNFAALQHVIFSHREIGVY
jgi:hypothetical protein